jgi:hypothetical protein
VNTWRWNQTLPVTLRFIGIHVLRAASRTEGPGEEGGGGRERR